MMTMVSCGGGDGSAASSGCIMLATAAATTASLLLFDANNENVRGGGCGGARLAAANCSSGWTSNVDTGGRIDGKTPELSISLIDGQLDRLDSCDVDWTFG